MIVVMAYLFRTWLVSTDSSRILRREKYQSKEVQSNQKKYQSKEVSHTLTLRKNTQGIKIKQI